jgi:hypothetical protein
MRFILKGGSLQDCCCQVWRAAYMQLVSHSRCKQPALNVSSDYGFVAVCGKGSIAEYLD